MYKLIFTTFALITLVVLAPSAFLTSGVDSPDGTIIFPTVESTVSSSASRINFHAENSVPDISEDTVLCDASVTVPVLVNGQISYLRLDRYLAGVLTAEMPASFPLEALKAQVVAARTYILRKRAGFLAGDAADECHNGAILCDDPSHCCAYARLPSDAESYFGKETERFLGVIATAVRETDGLIAVYEGDPIVAAFHSISGGMTENSGDVWTSDLPYLVSVDSPGEENAASYTSERSFPISDLSQILETAFPDASLSESVGEWFTDIVRSPSGKVISLSCGGVTLKGSALRSLLSLKSTDFVLEERDGFAVFKCVGYGHGVGMSQYGAKAMAENGAGFKDILTHYYSGVEITSFTTTETVPEP